ncbi:stage III sporulation protein AF [Fontibacillus phaseoli]|uniref:Stage III sporulation protein AF n=1 Tax=Fontibacillus phaseoli TaxID=1416533 RepID=A0A369BU53_9BACL|nr:stage III sporulation protein AF [Fontibacillus phaseoli]RCX23144.1 stage III sporulation protein AF [Fontibacillus phaseoli]
MNFLGEWLKEIIVVVLIAVFIDLLLPNRSMERYVKFVVSLLILLTLLSPVMRLFSSDAKQKIETAFADSWGNLGNSGTKASTEVILRQGEQLRKQHEQEALQWAGEEAARQMKGQIERETGLAVERVTVTLTGGKPSEETRSNEKAEEIGPSIKTVEVVMKQMGNSGNEQRSGEASGIKPVQKVKVDVSSPPEGSGTQTIEAMSKSETGISEQSEDSLEKQQVHALAEGQIEDLLYREWGISRESVTVVDVNRE